MAKAPRKKPARDVANKEKAEAKGRRKHVASPVSTGDRGGAFERRVQAVRLLAMCLGLQCPGARDGFVITQLLFQGRVFGHDTDDLIIYLWCPAAGQKAMQRLQMKRSLRATTNKIFNESVGLAWEDFSKPGFQRNLDECLIVYNVSSNSQMQGAVEVVRSAMASRAAEDWVARVSEEGFSNKSNRTAYAAIKKAVELQQGSPVEPEDLYQFVLHLKFMSHDLDSDRTIEVDTQKQLISHRISGRSSSDVWASLQSICTELNSTAGQISDDTAERHMGLLAKEFQAARAVWEGIHALQNAKLSNLKMSAHQTGGLPLSAEAHSHLIPLTELLQPLFSPGAESQGALMVEALPAAQTASADSLISRQLDRITQWQREHRYQDCLNQLQLLEDDLGDFDDHQEARWYLLRGLSVWHMGDDERAANDFDVAVGLYDSDDRIAAAAVRARMLRGQTEAAVETGLVLLKRFPESFVVWVATTNARLLAGERIREDDIPDAFTDLASAWQLVACSLAGADDDEGAVRAIRVALDKPDSSFFILETYLRYVLRLVTLDSVRVNCRTLLPDHATLLEDAVSRFDDRDSTLWAAQSPKTLSEVIAHLVYGMALLQRPEAALELLQQARMKGVLATQVMTRVEIEALCDLNRWKEITDRFQDKVSALPEESLLRFGHACLAQSRPDLLQIARDELARRTDSETTRHVSSMLRHLHWDLLLQADDVATVCNELEEASVTPQSQSVVDLYFASRAYQSDEVMRNRIEDRVAELAPVSSEPQELSMGARVMIYARRYDDAIGLLEKLLPVDAFTPLHVDLLHSYILTGRLAQARDLLESMPATWRSSPEAREQALFLYNSVGDWTRMREIIELNVADAPKDVGAWLMRIRVSACERVLDIDVVVSEVPCHLEGATKDLLLLASIEMRHGLAERGLNRIAFAMRNAQGDVEAAATHVQVMLLLPDDMAKVHQAPEFVAPGTSVELADAHGGRRHISLDFEGAAHPSGYAELIAPDSDFARQLIGLRVGETVSVPNLMGVQTLEVTQIFTLHRRLLELSHKLVSESVVPSKTLVSMTIPQDANGEMDLSFFHEQMVQHQAQVEKAFAQYEEQPIPLGLTAKRLGRDVIDLVRGWPLDGPWLDVSVDGLSHDVLPCPLDGSIWVVDLPMLTELAILELLDVLEHLPKVYVSTATRQALDMKLESLGPFRKSGTMFSHEGQLGFHEETETSHALNQTFLRSIDLAISNYCTIVPAYGPRQPTPLLQRLRDILDVEAHASLMLCLEYEADLLSLDGRLRQFALALEITSASPQMLLKAMAESGTLKPVEYSRALIKMIIAHRTFVTVNIADLIAMMDQGLIFANAGINGLRTYLANPRVEFHSATFTVIGFICQMYATGRCAFGIFLELIKHLMEPMFRHPHCPKDWVDLALRSFAPLRSHDFTPTHWALIQKQLISAQEEARSPSKLVVLEAQLVFMRVAPCYIHREIARLTSEAHAAAHEVT